MALESGYSGTPLPKKLGLYDTQKQLFIELPESVSPVLAGNFSSNATFSDWKKLQKSGHFDFVMGFSAQRMYLENYIVAIKTLIFPDGMFWVSWPKKASKVKTDITEDVIREICLPEGLVDIKVCAVNAIWSGLKLVVRRELREKPLKAN